MDHHLVRRMTRLLTACLAAVALVQTMAVVPAWACEATRKLNEPAPVANAPVEHSDCGESSSRAPTRHTTDCLLSCVSMAGCTSPGLVSERAFDDVVATESVTPPSLVEAYRGRSLAPDRPPPENS